MSTKTIPTLLTGLLLSAGLAQAADFEQQVSADPHGTVEISNVAGEVRVTGWDRPAVRVEARLGSGVQRVEVTSQGSRTQVKVVLPHISFFGNHDGSADLTVQVPRDSRVDVSSVSADVSAAGITGGQHLASVSGSVHADFATADMDVKTVSGDIELRGRSQSPAAGGVPQRVHVSSVSGDMRVTQAAGDIEVGTVSGDMTVQADAVRAARMHTTSGNVRFEGALLGGANIDAQTMSGELHVRARSQSGYQYEASTFSGDIRDCFNVEPTRTSRYGPGSRLSGALGTGSGQVTLKTLSGSVDLCDR